MIRAALLIIAMLFASVADARDRNLPYKFRKLNPCPANGTLKGACPGWQIDHVVALRCGGADSIENLQWLRVAAHKKKTREEARRCRKEKR